LIRPQRYKKEKFALSNATFKSPFFKIEVMKEEEKSNVKSRKAKAGAIRWQIHNVEFLLAFYLLPFNFFLLPYIIFLFLLGL